jgi:hypothetical protein
LFGLRVFAANVLPFGGCPRVASVVFPAKRCKIKTALKTTSGTPAYTIGLSKAVAARLSAYGMLLFFLAAGVFGSLTGQEGGTYSVLYIGVLFGTVVAHELIHGLFFRIFGGKPRYGAGIKYFFPYFYATSPGDAFPLRQMLIIGLAPLFTLSTLSLFSALVVPSLGGYLAVVFVSNAAGAVGDIWMTGRLVKFLSLKDATVVDLADGIAIYSQDAEAAKIASALQARDEQPPAFVMQWLYVALAVFAAQMLATFIGPFFADNLAIGPPQFPLIAFAHTPHSAEFTLGIGPPLLGGFIFALAARLLSRPHSQEVAANE